MDLRELCPDIRERDIWLYGDQEEIKEFLNIYAGQLHICGVVTEYADEVTIQPYMEWNIRAEKMDDLVYSPEQMIVICHHDFFQMLRWRLLYMGRKEYRDFISSNLVECLLYDKHLIVAMGTHLIAQSCSLLEKSKELSDRYSVVYYAESDLMEPYRNQLPECVHVARCCDIYLRSDCEKERYTLKILEKNVLAETCRVITVADYGFAGYFPQIERDRDRKSDHLLRGYERLDMSYETVVCAREDKEILRLCKEGKSEEDIVQTVGDMGFYSRESVNAHFDSEVERYKQLEEKADIRLGGFIEAHRGELLCRNLNEWHEPVVSYVADEILKRLALPALSMDRQERAQLLEDACGSDLPVYPSVRKALGLTEKNEDSKYRVVTYFSTRYMTRDEYIRYTIQYLYRALDLMEFTGMDMTLWQDDQEKSRERNVIEMLENAARLYRDKTAVRDINGECSFEELCRNAKAVGSALTDLDIFGHTIPVYMEKGIPALEVFWGITYAGGSYSLMNPIQPADRIEKILEVLDAPVIITDGEHLPALKEMRHSARILLAEDLFRTKIREGRLKLVKSRMTDADALYVNFTSGSTGIPKGVVVSHGSVIEFIHCFTETFGITSEDVIGNQAPFDFDVSVKDIYSMLLTGATLYIIPKDYFAFPKKILDVLVAEKITTLIWAVSALCVITTLKSFTYKVPTTVNKVLFSGEVMPVNHLREWMRVLPDATFVNLYGPTEITCNCTYYVIDRTKDEERIPIGKAFPIERVLLLDDGQNEVVEPNVEGEICVAGPTLALGYFRDKKKTDAVFVQNPLNDKNNELIYRTGDIAFYREDGNLVYVGRRDFQIKHMGHRIELGEIEACMNGINGVERVCCLYDDAAQQIVAFYQGTAEKSAVREALRSKLIKYMVPERYVTVETMPLTPNGKIDRKSLRQKYLEQE